ncbi:MAG TPA: D-Ala-D-Ala carboxypeptidase family metallohydrolase [Reyranella sp.]|nr:D-Ala-D-Ala carboxypeptidase family metallohydrolase [Reyranella sp.]HTE80401.1 D-Ala-D-Ala carboxypeptidase family metallohydrolase [Reyranella sp.]
MNLSPHFTIEEMIVTSQRVDNLPTPEIVANLKLLCEMVLEPVRALFGAPVIITSGYRSPAVNLAVGGAANSQHMSGQAADFIIPGFDPREVCRRINASPIVFHQLIFENYNAGWTHLGWPGVPARQAFELPSGQALS